MLKKITRGKQETRVDREHQAQMSRVGSHHNAAHDVDAFPDATVVCLHKQQTNTNKHKHAALSTHCHTFASSQYVCEINVYCLDE